MLHWQGCKCLQHLYILVSISEEKSHWFLTSRIKESLQFIMWLLQLQVAKDCSCFPTIILEDKHNYSNILLWGGIHFLTSRKSSLLKRMIWVSEELIIWMYWCQVVIWSLEIKLPWRQNCSIWRMLLIIIIINLYILLYIVDFRNNLIELVT